MTTEPTGTPIRELADELTTAMFDADPLTPAVLGIPSDRVGLPDLGREAEAAYRARLAALAARAEAVDPATLNGDDRVTREVIRAQATGQIAYLDSRVVEFTVTDLFVGPAASLLTVLPMIDTSTKEAGEAQLVRLAAVPHHLEQAAQRHREGIADGLTPVAHLVDAAIAHVDRYLAAPDSDPLMARPGPDEDYEKRRADLVTGTVRPAYAAYRDALAADVRPHARDAEHPGLCHLPGGDAIYRGLAAYHTTTDRTPRELHDTGLELIARLADEYRELGARVLGTTDLAEIYTRLREDPALRWSSGEEMVEAAKSAVARAEAQSPKWFGIVPETPCVVEPVPADAAPGSPAAYYMSPAQDGSRPGTYFINTYEPHERHRHSSEAIAFHEAVPGHHFQISLALGLDRLPLLRRIGGFTGYVEGWGLYSERLADEMGLYSDDVARLGMLTADSMRAGRLVTDTGLHALGWSRAQAVQYLVENTPMARAEIEVEIDRYIAYPGQALSYMVGRLELLRMRAAARETMGDGFDIRAFHDVVLGGGALPLSVLDGLVREWAAA